MRQSFGGVLETGEVVGPGVIVVVVVSPDVVVPAVVLGGEVWACVGTTEISMIGLVHLAGRRSVAATPPKGIQPDGDWDFWPSTHPTRNRNMPPLAVQLQKRQFSPKVGHIHRRRKVVDLPLDNRGASSHRHPRNSVSLE